MVTLFPCVRTPQLSAVALRILRDSLVYFSFSFLYVMQCQIFQGFPAKSFHAPWQVSHFLSGSKQPLLFLLSDSPLPLVDNRRFHRILLSELHLHIPALFLLHMHLSSPSPSPSPLPQPPSGHQGIKGCGTKENSRLFGALKSGPGQNNRKYLIYFLIDIF